MFKELIWVKDNSLSESFCNGMIEKFDVDPYRVKGKVDQNNPRVDKSLKITMDMGVTTNPTWQEEDKVLFKALEIALDEYELHLENISKQKCDYRGFKLHPAHNYECKDTGYKIQKYKMVVGLNLLMVRKFNQKLEVFYFFQQLGLTFIVDIQQKFQNIL